MNQEEVGVMSLGELLQELRFNSTESAKITLRLQEVILEICNRMSAILPATEIKVTSEGKSSTMAELLDGLWHEMLQAFAKGQDDSVEMPEQLSYTNHVERWMVILCILANTARTGELNINYLPKKP